MTEQRSSTPKPIGPNAAGRQRQRRSTCDAERSLYGNARESYADDEPTASVELELAVAREHIAGLQRALSSLGVVVCLGCYRVQQSESCPWCTGLEGRR